MVASECIAGCGVLFGRVDIVQRARIWLLQYQGIRLDQKFAWTGLAGADAFQDRGGTVRLVDGAQRFGQPVMAGPIGGGSARRIPMRDEMRHDARVEVRQVTPQHQPRRSWRQGLGGGDAGNGAQALMCIHHLRISRARGFGALIRPHRHEGPFDAGIQQVHGAIELILALVGQGGLVTPHARASAAGQHQAVEGGRSHGRHFTAGRAAGSNRG